MRITLFIGFLFSGIHSIRAQTDIVDGYTDKLSYRAGETVHFFINARQYVYANIGVFDMNGKVAATIKGVDLIPQKPVGAEPWKNGFGYKASLTTWKIPPDLQSGRYLIRTNHFPIPIIIKGNKDADIGRGIVVVIPTNTDEAYNTFGGGNSGDGTYGAHSLYDPDPFSNANYSKLYSIVSFLRPMQSYESDHYEGFLKWFLSAGYASVYNVNFISDKDMDDYSEIENAKLLIIIGHSEYWTRQARENFDRFVNSGISEKGYDRNAMVLSGNTMWWQVRYNVDQLVCYRSDGLDNLVTNTDDPEPETLLKTVEWWRPSLNYSTLSSIGGDSHFGYAGNGKNHDATGAPQCHGGFNGYKVIDENSPLLDGTNIHNADIIKVPTGEFDLTLIENADRIGYFGLIDPLVSF